jgi:hypothetical protein
MHRSSLLLCGAARVTATRVFKTLDIRAAAAPESN